MESGSGHDVRLATGEDARVIGELLHAFNEEYDEETPGPRALASRVRDLIAAGETRVLLVGEPAVGLAVMRFRPSIWTPGLECYLAELYVKPDRRGEGRGRALMEEVLAFARREGADYIDLNTSEGDEAARGLYSSLGFVNREGGPDGPRNLYYEIDLR
jgi:ribosomal protein S18 acetylase RimI-like enzyme